MYLVSDLSHKPVSTFDNIDDAIAYIAGWYQRSARHIGLVQMTGTTMFKVLPLEDSTRILGYITEGIPHNPTFVCY